MKKRIAILLTLSLVAAMFMQCSITVQAASLPTAKQFATPDQLKKFNTAASDSSEKIRFGKYNQEWWIAGSQNNNSIVLYADTPLGEWADWEIVNRTDPETGLEVYANHYGSSGMRSKLNGLETSYFTASERSQMKNTKVYTEDTLNNRVYSTTDKLYPGYGADGNKYFTVGANSEKNLQSGLKVHNSYWTDEFMNIKCEWLRNPPTTNPGYYFNYAMTYTGGVIDGTFGNVRYSCYLKPAFELDLSSVLFASAAPAASSDGKSTLDDAMTLRYSTSSLGSAQITFDKSKVKLSNVPADTYLVAQSDAGAFVKSVSGTKSVSAADMGLSDFKNCKVWLETTDKAERMTYATMATQQQKCTVEVISAEGLEITSKKASQTVGAGDSIADIVVKLKNGYHLTEGYFSDLQSLLKARGLTVTETSTGFTITGKPTADVRIQLAAATKNKKENSDENKNSKVVTTGDYNRMIPIALGATILAIAGVAYVLFRKKFKV